MTLLLVALGFALLILGAMVGHSLAQESLRYEIRRTAESRRVLGEQWRALKAERTARRESAPWV